MPVISPKELRETYLLKLQSSGLNTREADKLKFQLLTPEQTKKLGHKQLGAFRIPYFDLKGKPTKFYRIRYLETTKTGFARATDVKEQRYEQPKDTVNEVYMPPFWKPSWQSFADNPKSPLYITEGELKAACATLLGFPTIGLGGVWMFMSTKAEQPILPIFSKLGLAGRKVYIVFDSDAALNPNVAAAEHMLCVQLLKLGAEPYIIRLPSLEDKKTGLDDFLVAKGKAAFAKLSEEAVMFHGAEHLYGMNQDVIYIRQPSLIIEHETQMKMSVRVFKTEAYVNRTYIDYAGGEKPKTIRTAEAWMGWMHRAEAQRCVYEPGKPPLWDGNYNMWHGMPFAPKKGDIKPWLKLMDYVFKGDPASRKWFEQWCAYPLQHLGTKLFTAVVLWSVAHGTGKTLIGHTLQRIYGNDNSILIRHRDLMSGNNSYAENKQLVVGEEITGDERRSIMDELKGLITNDEMRINIKYVPEYTIRSCINFLFTSNNPDAFLISEADRRFFVHEIEGQPLPTEFYTREYDPWYKSADGIAALLHYFLNLDLEGYEPKARAPMTRAKREMIEDSRTSLESWLAELKINPEILPTKRALWTADELYQVFDPDGKKSSLRKMGIDLKRMGFERAAGGVGCATKRGQVRLWVIRDNEKIAKLKWKDVGLYYDKEMATASKPKKYEAK